MSAPSGFERRTAQKKRSILETTQALFVEKGMASLTISEIAKKAGVSQVSIYNYFSSKEGLLEAIIRKHLEASLSRAEEVLDSDISFKEKIAVIFRLGEEAKDETDAGLLNAIEWKDPMTQRIYGKFIAERQIPFLMRFIEQGKEGGVIKKELSTEAILTYFHANRAMYRNEDLLRKGSDYIANLSHLFFYGILGN